MAHLIDKDDLAAEIKKRFDEYSSSILKHYDACKEAKAQELGKILTILDNLEVKEVDLDEELENILEKEKAFVTDNREVKYYNGDSFNHIYELEFIAKHFFELGMQQSKNDNDNEEKK